MMSEKNPNQILETFISMKIDAECDENAPAIAFCQVHEDLQHPCEAWKGAKKQILPEIRQKNS